eukprot:CCRYP_000666-RB/>CCRYP_000666-RB protein AED:0.22 eAED:0.22 QI:211/1/1/1/0.83/0.71/7/631/662
MVCIAREEHMQLYTSPRFRTKAMFPSLRHLWLATVAMTMLTFLPAFLSFIPIASAMNMSNMLMGQTLESFLSDLVSFGAMSVTQKDDILRMSTQFDPQYNPNLEELREVQNDVFSSEESKQALRSYLYDEIDTDFMEYETAEAIASVLSLGALYPRDSFHSGIFIDSPLTAVSDGPAGSSYTGNGNVERLGRSNVFGVGTNKEIYNGIWGYSVGSREYALQCHGYGLNILDVTDPSSIFRVQFVPMTGGGIWRDVVTNYDSIRGKTYAYVGAQGNQGDGKDPNLFVIDLSNLSGNEPHAVDENPAVVQNLGKTPEFTHTINAARGLLFLNTANSKEGCRVYDLVADPMNPRFLFKTGGSVGRDCHDSSVVTVGSRDLFIVSDGTGRCQRIWDITDVDQDWNTGDLPVIIGQTQQVSGIYAHSNWVSEDKRYLFSFDENNAVDITVHDISDPTQPTFIKTFQYSGNAEHDAIPHNGEIRGRYLYVAYYMAGLRIFDVSNPYQPYEVGKDETFRDPNGDGVFENPDITAKWNGAWNTYPYLSSGNVLVSDELHGLFVVKQTPPYGIPGRFFVTSQLDGSGYTVLSWTAATNARGYSVLRSNSSSTAPFTPIAEHLLEMSYIDQSAPSEIGFYRIVAINGEGNRASRIVSSNGTVVGSKASKRRQ